MKKIITLYILLFQSFLYGCATCQLMTPTAELNISIDIQNKGLNNIHMQWNFSDIYTSETVAQYDKNKNDILDDNELDIIQKAMLEYLIPKNMLTKVNYAKNAYTENSIELEPSYKNFKLKVINDYLVFTYDSNIDVAIDIENNSSLSFVFEDDENYFAFVVTDLSINTSEIYHQNNLYLFMASVLFRDTPFKEKQINNKIQSDETQPAYDVVNTQETKAVKELKTTKEDSLQTNILKDSITKIKSLFESIKDEKNPITYISLLIFAYIYGVIHALGPGHGKTLVASYFLSNERSYSKALFISLAIGIVHTFSAFILTLIIYFSVNTFLAQFLNDTVFYTTVISSLIIIFIAIYLIYKKYKLYKHIQEIRKEPAYSFSNSPQVSTCSCSSCKVDTDSTDTALIISAGIIPCPGTITIFIFSLSLGLYYAGFLSALVMSLGMSTIIFFSAILSVVVRKKSIDSNSNLKKYFEYGSLIVILMLGIILLLTA